MSAGLPDLAGRTAVITGASRGLGAALARDFAARGMNLGLCARSAPELPASSSVVAVRTDVAVESEVDAFAAEVERRFGAIDLWINNAGVLAPIDPLRDVPAADFLAHLQVNVMGVVHGTRAYLRHLHARAAAGVLINVSSGAAWQGYAGWSAYCAGKAAVDRITECVQLEEGEERIRAHAVAPGVIDTAMQELIRSCPPERFPDVERFRQMKNEDSFNSPEFVAANFLAIAFDPAARPGKVLVRLPAEFTGQA